MSSISNPIPGAGTGGGESLAQTLILGDLTGASSGIFFSDGDGANFASSSELAFSSTVNPFGAKDLFIGRKSANVLQIGTVAGGADGKLTTDKVEIQNLIMSGWWTGLGTQTGGIIFGNAHTLQWGNSANEATFGAGDAGISRIGVATLGIGNGTTGDTSGTLSLAALGARAATSDVATSDLVITGMDAYAQATAGQDEGSDLILAGGIGVHSTEVVDYTQTGYTVIITVNGDATVLIEGIEWTNVSDNATSAGLLATAIDSLPGVSAVAVAAVVHVTADIETYSLLLAETGTGNTVANKADGDTIIPGLLKGHAGENLTMQYQTGKGIIINNTAGNPVHSFVSGALVSHDNIPVQFGNSSADSFLSHSTAQTVHSLVIALGVQGRSLLIIDNGDQSFDFAHSQQANPTLFIHSAAQSTTEWGSLAHDGTGFVLRTGSGNFDIGTVPIQGTERSDPAAPDANVGVLYFRDSGGGKTELVCRFNTGAIQVVAIEP